MIIQFPVPALAVVVRELEQALALARRGKVEGIALSYMAEGEMHDCVEARNLPSAVSLLGQSNMLRVDLIELVKRLREQSE